MSVRRLWLYLCVSAKAMAVTLASAFAFQPQPYPGLHDHTAAASGATAGGRSCAEGMDSNCNPKLDPIAIVCPSLRRTRSVSRYCKCEPSPNPVLTTQEQQHQQDDSILIQEPNSDPTSRSHTTVSPSSIPRSSLKNRSNPDPTPALYPLPS